jgi:hypothetical protein
MTDPRMRDRTTTHTIAPMLLTTFCLAACEAFVGNGPAAPYQGETDPNGAQAAAGSGSSAPSKPSNNAGASAKPSDPQSQAGAGSKPSTPPTSDPGNPPPANDPPSVCDEAPQKALATLTTYCGSCHSNPATAKAGFSTILDAPALLASGKIVADKPDMSLVYKRISAGSMPPTDVAKRPGTADIEAIKTWITCGADDWNDPSVASLDFVSIDSRLRWVLDDLRSFPNPIDRERMRYLDISSLANGGYSKTQVEVYRQAIAFLMNSLSRGRTVIKPVPVDKNGLIYRIDLRDFLWDAASWTQLEAIYPYAVIYDQDSRLFPFDEVTAEQIREETNTQIPVIQADWFISHASRPPLYYSLLELPETLDELGQQLGVDIQRNIDTEQVLRSGFANAGPSQNNRVIERHELGGNRGALWVSYDFANNLDLKNIFAHPLDFQEDGGEMIFNLENGLQGYYIADAAGTRLDKAPNNVVQDPAARDGAVESGLSCMNCHQQDGQLPKYDEIRDFQLNAGANAEEIEQVLALYVTQSELQAAFDADQNRYRTAHSALDLDDLTNTTMHELDDRHLGIIDLNVVAGVVGIPAETLKRAIDASPQALPPEIVTLRTKGGGIQRDSFEAIVGDLIDGLGLGDQLLVNASGAPRIPSSNDDNDNNNNSSPDAGAGDQPSGAAGSGSSSGGDSRRN